MKTLEKAVIDLTDFIASAMSKVGDMFLLIKESVSDLHKKDEYLEKRISTVEKRISTIEDIMLSNNDYTVDKLKNSEGRSN